MTQPRMQSIYLSPQSPRWAPRTEADLDNAIQQTLLEETHYLDIKRVLAWGWYPLSRSV